MQEFVYFLHWLAKCYVSSLHLIASNKSVVLEKVMHLIALDCLRFDYENSLLFVHILYPKRIIECILIKTLILFII